MNNIDFAIILNSLIVACSAVFAIANVPVGGFASLVVLMMFDFIVGLGKSYTLKVPITSYRIKVGAMSKVGTLLVILSFGIGLSFIDQDFSKELYIGWVLGMFILSELYSILSNVHAIKTGENLPEVEVIAIIGKRVRHLLETLTPNKK